MMVEKIDIITEKIRHVNLEYLHTLTKSNPKLMKEMIKLYLQQTPPLISIMKKSFHDKDWQSLSSVIHKMIPSFLIMGMKKDFEATAYKIQKFTNGQTFIENISAMVSQLEKACGQACQKLKDELGKIK